jgi:hypothetical protein
MAPLGIGRVPWVGRVQYATATRSYVKNHALVESGFYQEWMDMYARFHQWAW